MGSPCEKGYTSHYTLVSKKKVSRKVCRAQSDFEIVEGLVNYFPVEDGDEVQGDEVGIFEPVNVLPRFVVRYTVQKIPTRSFSQVRD